MKRDFISYVCETFKAKRPCFSRLFFSPDLHFQMQHNFCLLEQYAECVLVKCSVLWQGKEKKTKFFSFSAMVRYMLKCFICWPRWQLYGCAVACAKHEALSCQWRETEENMGSLRLVVDKICARDSFAIDH